MLHDTLPRHVATDTSAPITEAICIKHIMQTHAMPCRTTPLLGTALPYTTAAPYRVAATLYCTGTAPLPSRCHAMPHHCHASLSRCHTLPCYTAARATPDRTTPLRAARRCYTRCAAAAREKANAYTKPNRKGKTFWEKAKKGRGPLDFKFISLLGALPRNSAIIEYLYISNKNRNTKP